MRYFYFFLTFFLVHGTFAQELAPTNGPVGTSTCFAVYSDENVILLNLNDRLYKSTDNGVSWIQEIDQLYTPKIGPLSFVKVDDVLIMGTEFGDRSYRSTDNGNTWYPSIIGMPMQFSAPSALPTQAVNINGTVILGGPNFMRKSTDAGGIWQSMDLNGPCKGISVVDNEVWAFNNGNLYFSTDEGESWTQAGSNPTNESSVLGMKFFGNDSRLFACVYQFDGGLYYSDDHGDTWTSIENIEYAFQMTKFNDELYVSTDSGILISSDNGDTWEELNLDNTASPLFLDKLNDNSFWAATTEGAVRYNVNTEEEYSPMFTISNATDVETMGNTVFAIADNKCFRSYDNGQSWFELTNNVNDEVNVIRNIYTEGSTLWLEYSTSNFDVNRTIVYSNDEGETFQTLPTSPISLVSGSWRIGVRSIIYNSSSSTYWFSDDNGNTWEEASVEIANETGVIGGDFYSFTEIEGNILTNLHFGFAISDDNGQSWTHYFSDEYSFFNIFGWSDRYIGLAMVGGANLQILLESTDQGATWENYTEGFPTAFGNEEPIGLSMVGDKVYCQSESELFYEPGKVFSIENFGPWQEETGLGVLPSNLYDMAGNGNGLFAALKFNGVWFTDGVTVGTKNFKQHQETISIFPNPSQDRMSVSHSLKGEVIYEIRNVQGQLLSYGSAKEEIFTINSSDLSEGLYFLTLKKDKEIITRRFVKQ